MDFLIIRPDNSNPNKTGKALDLLVLRSLRYKSISMYFNLVNASWFLFVECNRHKGEGYQLIQRWCVKKI